MYLAQIAYIWHRKASCYALLKNGLPCVGFNPLGYFVAQLPLDNFLFFVDPSGNCQLLIICQAHSWSFGRPKNKDKVRREWQYVEMSQ